MKSCRYCHKTLTKTIYMQGRWVHKAKTKARWEKKQFCNGQCANKFKVQPVNYGGFV